MKWTYSITPFREEGGEASLRLRVSFNSKRVDMLLGLKVEVAKWDKDTMRVRPNTFHTKKRVPANYINRTIQSHIDTVESIFYSYEDKGIVPTADRFRDDFNTRLGKSTASSTSLVAIAEKMMKEVGPVRQWAQSGYDKMVALIRKINAVSPDCKVEDIDTEWMDAFVKYLTYSERLNNSTVVGYIKRIKALLAFAEREGHTVRVEAKTYTNQLKTIPKPVIFLTWEELMNMLTFELPFPYLEKARDLFCISAFTGLRYSDLAKLQPSDITDEYITVVTKKTSDPLRIDINKYSRQLLDKYDNKIPQLSNQKCNKYIKEVGMYCGINEPIRTVAIKGGKRVERVQPKWQMLSTHAGRRTFICNALMLGIPPDVVMKWTGHKDYDAMRPYIAIADGVKKEMMDRFNAL
ncbi:hypothetical protein HMPREF3027_07220 [Porphyromonas sp. HMSC077F02]|uniref:site-specific integrase n=1 Tax=Porphyromonas sp. HMSC077F02 TaxID=1739529 RepID=UPI0008A103F8|nr:site-specific integrase [Porphyromonas sp. HMSC077F02]OFO52018.1 hypothetical protein HMPREF3027_07220 [Porphyromonas sp. HMSC077F02]